MRDLRKEILGFVLTVISHEPRRYFVLAEEVNSDPLEMVRWVYSFNHGHDPNIIAKVTSRLIDARFHERENQMHYETIRFALRKIREYPEVTEFLFTSNDMESTNEVSVIKGLDLRYQILRFFYDVYAGGLPQQGISVYDLCYNFPNDMQDMQGWVTDLDQAGFLIRTRTDQKYVTTDNRTTSSQAHKINPQRLADIQAELRKWQSEQGMTIETRRLDMEQQYDVALSYASENGKYVRSVADSLKAHSVSVFYDEYEKIPLWGKNPAVELDSIYRVRSKFVVIFISHFYAEKMWTILELKSTLTRAVKEKQEYVLPARFDDTELPGISKDSHFYVDLRDRSPEQFAQDVMQKIKGLPPVAAHNAKSGTNGALVELERDFGLEWQIVADGSEDVDEGRALLMEFASRIMELVRTNVGSLDDVKTSQLLAVAAEMNKLAKLYKLQLGTPPGHFFSMGSSILKKLHEIEL